MPSSPPRKLTIDFLLNEEANSVTSSNTPNTEDGRARRRRVAVAPNVAGNDAVAGVTHTPVSSRDLSLHQFRAKVSPSESSQIHMRSPMFRVGESSTAGPLEQPKPFQCEICQKRFVERGEVLRSLDRAYFTDYSHKERYVYIWQSQRKFLCLFLFLIGNLNKHVSSVHFKEKPRVCPEPGCGKSFAFRDGLMRHITHVHKNQRQHTCSLCGKSFKQPSHLGKHMRSIHKHSPWYTSDRKVKMRWIRIFIHFTARKKFNVKRRLFDIVAMSIVCEADMSFV